ncbi:hypothetical protein NQ314_016962 [Rhamnusium bicolor]|uniref:PiggyBac transposable element-derived protein domain-containing protein n=1 Tax=Rhamnusium bicolor TaxID=1586634 RepID=A0AAV8WX92_9CUCU|nr:hypothetical protein NQ314_016962 [Rhamnusium bicolor]
MSRKCRKTKSFSLLDEVDTNKLNTDDEADFSDDSIADPDYLPITNNFYNEAMLQQVDDEAIESCLAMDESAIEKAIDTHITLSNISESEVYESIQGPANTDLLSISYTMPMSQRLCVDEQMCSTKMVSHLRQYMPAKPHKWGMKLFVLCDSYGYSYGFELYSGAGDNVILNGAPDLGAAASAVSRKHSKTLNIELPVFRRQVVAILCKNEMEEPVRKSVGHPRSTPTPPAEIPVRRLSKETYLPIANTRFDGLNHWPEWMDRSGKRQCKLPECKSETYALVPNEVLTPPKEDDISVTASPTPSPQPPPAFPGVPPPPLQNTQLFNNALAASLFLNTPLLPPPGQWFYSQLYPHDWSWMNLRSNAILPRTSPQEDNSQNPDSSSEKLDVTEIEEETKDAKENSKDGFIENYKDSLRDADDAKERKSFNEGINLSLRVRKASITLVRQKDEVSSSEKDNLKCSRHVWRPY